MIWGCRVKFEPFNSASQIILIAGMADSGISLASFVPMVAKWWLNSSANSFGFVTDCPFSLSSLTDYLPDLREVSSFIICQVKLV